MAPAIEVKGLKEFRKELKAIDAQWPKELRKVHKAIADKVAEGARGRASGGNALQASQAGQIRGYATQTESKIGFPGKSKAGAAFWGIKYHKGWYGWRKYDNSATRQAPEWVGANWEPGVSGQGPYFINDAIADMSEEIIDEFNTMIDDLVAKAFPD